MDTKSFGKRRSITSEDNTSQLVRWNSENVAEAKQKINDGWVLKRTPFFENDVNWRKGNISYEYSEAERLELKRCRASIIYFAAKYAFLMTDNGYANITLRDYQKTMMRDFQKHRNNIVLASRQVGKTTTTAIFLAWYLCFHYDKNVLFLANKDKTVKEVVDKTIKVLQFVPFFIKPGLINKNQKSIILDNGSKLVSDATTKNSSIGFTIHLLYVDEFAHIPSNILNEFWKNVYPTLSSSDISRVILTSTANGKNLFYDLYNGAVNQTNAFYPTKIHWWQVKGRGEEWKKKQIQDLGGGRVGEEAFNEQYGCQFLASSDNLISNDLARKLTDEKIKLDTKTWFFDKMKLFRKHYGMKFIEDYSSLESMQEYFHYLTIDIAEGGGGDNSVINLFRLKFREDLLTDDAIISPFMNLYDFFYVEQCGIYCDNDTSVKDLAFLCYILMFILLDSEQTRCLFEYNTYGEEFYLHLQSFFGDKNMFDDGIFVKTHHRATAKNKKEGVRWNSSNKSPACKKLGDLLSFGSIVARDENSIEELLDFGKDQRGNYSGQLGNDDISMSFVSMGIIMDTEYYKEIVEDYFDTLDASIQDKIMSSLDKEYSKGHSGTTITGSGINLDGFF